MFLPTTRATSRFCPGFALFKRRQIGRLCHTDTDELQEPSNLARKMCETVVWAACRVCVGWVEAVVCKQNLLSDWDWRGVPEPHSLLRASVAALRARASLCSTADLVVPRKTRATCSVRTMNHKSWPPFGLKRKSRSSRKCCQKHWWHAVHKGGNWTGSEVEGPWCMMARKMACWPVGKRT